MELCSGTGTVIVEFWTAFCITADLIGEREIIFSVDENSRPHQTFSDIVENFPQLANRELLFSINQEYARGDEILRDGDELAIFTAVSGG